MSLYDAEKIEACARAAHEANRAYCILHGDGSPFGSGENTTPPEEEARAMLVHAFQAYLRAQKSHGTWETFLDWVVDERDVLVGT